MTRGTVAAEFSNRKFPWESETVPKLVPSKYIETPCNATESFAEYTEPVIWDAAMNGRNPKKKSRYLSCILFFDNDLDHAIPRLLPIFSSCFISFKYSNGFNIFRSYGVGIKIFVCYFSVNDI